LELSLTHLHCREVEPLESRSRFHVFDVSSRIVIEAPSQDDALYLCSEMGWEFICECED